MNMFIILLEVMLVTNSAILVNKELKNRLKAVLALKGQSLKGWLEKKIEEELGDT